MTMELSPYRQRVLTERDELVDRLISLSALVINSSSAVSPTERIKLVRQRDLMQQYLDVLNERVDS